MGPGAWWDQLTINLFTIRRFTIYDLHFLKQHLTNQLMHPHTWNLELDTWNYLLLSSNFCLFTFALTQYIP